jgi:hypothetical protein
LIAGSASGGNGRSLAQQGTGCVLSVVSLVLQLTRAGVPVG